jgi:anti-sigma regulatory factor (Ser/Thr protein kinase)
MAARFLQLVQDVPAARRGELAFVGASGSLDEVAVDVERDLFAALAEDPQAVVCDLTGVRAGTEAAAARLVAAAAGPVAAWPAVPVALVCADEALRSAIGRAPGHDAILLSTSIARARTEVAGRLRARGVWLSMAARPDAGRRARDFVRARCHEWGMRELIDDACLVASELVTNSVRHAGTPIEVGLSHLQDRLRVTVRDLGDGEPRKQPVALERPSGRGLLLVDRVSTGWGVLPTRGRGKLTWAVLSR